MHPTRTHQAFGGSAGSWRSGREPGVAAIGETGLDYHLPRKHRLTQLLWFRYQLAWPGGWDCPWCCTSAWRPGRPGHAAAQAASAARRGDPLLPGGLGHYQPIYLDLGFCLGIGGALLRRESEACGTRYRAPLDRLLVETDSPYVLPDVPWTGSKNP